MTRPPIDADDVARAAARLTGRVHRTPVLTSSRLDARTGAAVWCKAEHLQHVGAFKLRGATNAVALLPAAVRARGVVAYSSGNHAQAVAAAAQRAGVPATIVMPSDAPAVKAAATRGYGARIVTYDRYREDRAAIAAVLAAQTGAAVIPPFDDPAVMAGQGTVAQELAGQVDHLDVLVAPIGGGGLLSGCAVAARAAWPDIRIVGVEPTDRRAARDALATGAVVSVPVPATCLDGQQTTSIGHGPLAVLRAVDAEVVGVTDAEVRETMGWLATRMKQVVEPSGAAALAAVLAGRVAVTGLRVGVVLSGGNVAPELLAEVLAAGPAERPAVAPAERPAVAPAAPAADAAAPLAP